MDAQLDEVDVDIVVKFIEENISYISEGVSEQVLRDNFTSYLRRIFDEEEKWVTRYVSGTESAVSLNRENRETTGFVDNLVDATAIEYESNLNIRAKYEEGYDQVKEYCAAIINAGFNPDHVIGILSDTIRWYAYAVSIKSENEENLSKNDIELIEIDFIGLNKGEVVDANKLIRFIREYLARIGSSVVSSLECRVKSFQFYSGILRGELPINCGIHVVSCLLPSFDLFGKVFHGIDSAV